MTKTFKSLCIAVALALSVCSASQAAVVVSSKLSSESAMLGQMIRLMLNANGVATIDRTRIGATPVVRKALLAGRSTVCRVHRQRGFLLQRRGECGLEGP